LHVLEKIDTDFLFILETNGILLGYDSEYVHDLSQFPHVHVRVCLKGCDRNEFSLLTGADPSGFEYQLDSLVQLKKDHVRFNIAIASPKKEKYVLYERLQSMGLGNVMVEEEQLKLYPQVKKRLKTQGLLQLFKN